MPSLEVSVSALVHNGIALLAGLSATGPEAEYITGTYLMAGLDPVTLIPRLVTLAADGTMTGGTLAGLTDVNITSPGDGTFLQYNAATGKWLDSSIVPGSGSVTSVGIVAPAVFSVTNSPITTNGNITLAFTGGTTAQFLRGDGTWSNTLVGPLVLSGAAANLTIPASTATAGIIYQGATRFIHTYKDPAADGYNTFVGVNAGNFTMSPGGGASDLSSYNTAIGHSAMSGNTIGYQNVAIGTQALQSNTAGYSNVAVGYASLAGNTDGSNNVAVGLSALSGNTAGISNIAVGSNALRLNISGSYNTSIGLSSLYNSTASFNSALGFLAGYGDSSSNQISVTDDYCVFIGAYASRNNASAIGNGIAIGYNAKVLQSNQAVLGTMATTSTLLYGNITNYDVYTDAANNSYGSFGFVSNVLTIGTQKMGSGAARAMVLQTGGVTALTIDTGQGSFFTSTAVAAGATAFKVTPGAHTAVVAEVIDNSFATHTMTITGSYTTNRSSLFAAPTITAASALTVTNAATLAISGAPIAAGSAVITNPYAFWIQAGKSLFEDQIGFGATAIVANGANVVTPPSTLGPVTLTVLEWVKVQGTGGAQRYMPLYG